MIIGMAEIGIAKPPEKVITLGLGSCVGVCFYDKINKVAGMVHIVLPTSTGQTANLAKFADTGVTELLHRMLRAGANRRFLSAKLAGGAHVFACIGKNDLLKVGERNAAASREAVRSLGIPIVAEDLGGTYGRTIELNPEDGSLMVKTVGQGVSYM